MTDKVKPIPDGMEGAIPYLVTENCSQAIDFYKKAFGATETMRFESPDGKIGHAEIRIGNALIMLSDEHPEMGFKSPKAYGGSPAGVMVYVEDVDALFEQAKAAGAKVTRPPADQFYGDRSAGFEDPSGHTWYFATHIEDVSPDELQRRHDALYSAKGNEAAG